MVNIVYFLQYYAIKLSFSGILKSQIIVFAKGCRQENTLDVDNVCVDDNILINSEIIIASLINFNIIYKMFVP